jgi:hypothetical protein
MLETSQTASSTARVVWPTSIQTNDCIDQFHADFPFVSLAEPASRALRARDVARAGVLLLGRAGIHARRTVRSTQEPRGQYVHNHIIMDVMIEITYHPMIIFEVYIYQYHGCQLGPMRICIR